MKGFIEITPRYYNSGMELLGEEGSWTIQEKESLNINSIIKFGKNFIYTSNHPESYPTLTVECYDEIKKLIEQAQ